MSYNTLVIYLWTFIWLLVDRFISLVHFLCFRVRSFVFVCGFFFFQAEDGIRDRSPSRGLGDVYKRQGYYIKDTYKYQTNLSLKVQGGEVGSTTDCQVKIENPTGSTVNVTISGFNNAGGSMSNFEKFTVTGVNVTKANNGSYSLSLGAFEADTQKTTGEALAINGTSLNGTINADGTATVSIVFSPGSMPMPITAEFTGSNTQSSAQ